MSTTLVRGDTTVTLPDPTWAGGKQPRVVTRQVLGRTQGGTVVVHDKGVNTYEMIVPYHLLSESEMSNLYAFYLTNAEGMQNTWTYTDEYGNTYTARFLDNELVFESDGKDIYSIDLNLEIDAMGV